MAADTHAEAMGQRGHMPPRRDASDAPQVDQHNARGARFQQPRVVGDLIQVLTGRQRHVQRRAQTRHARDIGVPDRILDPNDAGLL